MQDNWEVIFILLLKDLWDKFSDWWSSIFFIYHVKTCNEISLLLVFLNVQNHLFIVIFSNNLQTADDNSNLEQWIVSLHLLNYSFEYLNLSLSTYYSLLKDELPIGFPSSSITMPKICLSSSTKTICLMNTLHTLNKIFSKNS